MVDIGERRLKKSSMDNKLKLRPIRAKKSTMGQVISIFITVLLVSVIAGMTFLFVGSLKDEAENIAGADSNAYIAINTTEAAGMTVTNFLSILFLALIFSAILTVVLRIVLPFINVGNQLGGGF